jgi:hypothetical protein
MTFEYVQNDPMISQLGLKAKKRINADLDTEYGIIIPKTATLYCWPADVASRSKWPFWMFAITNTADTNVYLTPSDAIFKKDNFIDYHAFREILIKGVVDYLSSIPEPTNNHNLLKFYSRDTLLEFGKFKGYSIEELGKKWGYYLLWCVRNIPQFVICKDFFDATDKSGFSLNGYAELCGVNSEKIKSLLGYRTIQTVGVDVVDNSPIVSVLEIFGKVTWEPEGIRPNKKLIKLPKLTHSEKRITAL